jgi:hypothetical protein
MSQHRCEETENILTITAVFIIAHGAAGNFTRIRILNASAVSNQQKALCGMNVQSGKRGNVRSKLLSISIFLPLSTLENFNTAMENNNNEAFWRIYTLHLTTL